MPSQEGIWASLSRFWSGVLPNLNISNEALAHNSFGASTARPPASFEVVGSRSILQQVVQMAN